MHQALEILEQEELSTMEKPEDAGTARPAVLPTKKGVTPRIAIQGVSGTFHEIAARQFFGGNIEVVPALSFAELFADFTTTSGDIQEVVEILNKQTTDLQVLGIYQEGNNHQFSNDNDNTCPPSGVRH